MTRSQSSILTSLIGKLPRGFALGKRDGVLDAVLDSIAAVLVQGEAGAEKMMDEIDPRTANALLSDFERVLGPDPCGRDLGNQTLDQRQRRAHQRWIAKGGASIPYFVQMAASLGYTIEIEDFWPSKAGVLRAGQPLIAEGEQFTWRVKLQLISQWLFRVGVNQAGQPLGGYQISDIECELRRLKPAHTQLTFSYLEN